MLASAWPWKKRGVTKLIIVFSVSALSKADEPAIMLLNFGEVVFPIEWKFVLECHLARPRVKYNVLFQRDAFLDCGLHAFA